MTALPIVLLIAGATLICVEVFMPGFGICGVLGIISIVLSAIITITTTPFGIFVVIAEGIALVALVALVLRYVKKKQLYGKIILDETLADDVNDIGDLSYFMGKEGITKTPLRLFGEAEFNGRPVEVLSDGGYIPENRRVRVTAVENNRVMVKPVLEQ